MQYKVLQHFQWGQLKLEQGQIIQIDAIDDRTALVYRKHYPEKQQIISSKAIENMVAYLKKIEKY